MLRLMWEFFKAGLFAVGGGLATIPFLQEIARNYNYFTEKDLLDMIAVSESTPGAIGINVATFAGFKAYGIPGAILATISLVTGPIIIILIIARAMAKFKSSKIVNDMFFTIRPATGGLILGAMSSVMVLTLLDIDLFKLSGNLLDLFRLLPISIFAIFLFVQVKFKKINPLIIIGISGILGIVFSL